MITTNPDITRPCPDDKVNRELHAERLMDADVDPSLGRVGDSDDNALAESVIGLVKTEVIKQIGPWKSMQDVEWEATH